MLREEKQPSENPWTDLIDDPEGVLKAVDKSSIYSALFEIDDAAMSKIPKGITTASLYPDGFGGAGLKVSCGSSMDEPSLGDQIVYWLPYDESKASTVSADELNKTNALVFLTTTFSGCRFVATDRYVSHVPSGTAETLRELSVAFGNTISESRRGALGRDSDEKKGVSEELGEDQDPSLYSNRKILTPTQSSEMDAMVKYQYKADPSTPIEEIENVVVIGVRKDPKDPFHFFGQKTCGSEYVTLLDLGETLCLTNSSTLDQPEQNINNSNNSEQKDEEPDESKKVPKEASYGSTAFMREALGAQEPEKLDTGKKKRKREVPRSTPHELGDKANIEERENKKQKQDTSNNPPRNLEDGIIMIERIDKETENLKDSSPPKGPGL